MSIQATLPSRPLLCTPAIIDATDNDLEAGQATRTPSSFVVGNGAPEEERQKTAVIKPVKSFSSSATSYAGKDGVSVHVYQMDNAVWPSKQNLKQNAIRTRRDELRKNWSCFSGLKNRKQRIWARVIITVLVIGAAIGLGVGISKTVGGSVYSSNGQNQQIPADT